MFILVTDLLHYYKISLFVLQLQTKTVMLHLTCKIIFCTYVWT